MPRFFVSEESIDRDSSLIVISGEDARHISRSLRMAVGDKVTVCDGKSFEYLCSIGKFENDSVICAVEEKRGLTTEPPFLCHVYQALPKGDKLDTVIQKSTECGASSFTVFESEFCIAK